MTKYTNFCAESATEEYAVLVGRIEALAVYLETERLIDSKVIAAMLGIELEVKE